MEIEWDVAKNQSNIIKHGIDFCYASKIFEDENCLLWEDNRFNYRETRYITIGNIEDVIYTVVYTLRYHAYRIISARGASRHERKIYHHYLESEKCFRAN